MDKTISRLTVYFEDPFWVGIFERVEDGKLSACKVTFGAEPKDGEVYDFVLRHYSSLRFSPAVEAHVKQDKRNPKRLQRDVKKQLQNCAAGTKAQQALQLQREQNKQERKTKSRAEKLAEQQRLFALKQQKKKQKHRGR
ncbi:MAG: YjdF family protein [Oscillospiraceae bacterium]|nr:YjdF family protein [Oscillospiraceae bacterium]